MITNGILKSINTKDKLYKALVKTDCTNSTLYNTLKTNFKAYKYILSKTVREAKKVYYNRVFLQYKDNIVKTCSVIKQTLNKNTQHNDLPAMFVHNDMIVDTPNNIANSFNEYFINIGSQLAESLN